MSAAQLLIWHIKGLSSAQCGACFCVIWCWSDVKSLAGWLPTLDAAAQEFLTMWWLLNRTPDSKDTNKFSWSIIPSTSPVTQLPSFSPPGSSAPITSEGLRAVTNDVSNTSDRVITFSVIRHPKLGRLVARQPDNSTVDVSSFTQDMVSGRRQHPPLF